MKTRIQYSDVGDQHTIEQVAEQTALGKVLVGNETLFTGNFLVFEDGDESHKVLLEKNGFRVLFKMMNDIRGLQAKNAWSKAQFRDWIRGL